MHSYKDLINIFNRLFKKSFNTILVAGEKEPIYLPTTKDCQFNQIVFANFFFSSALHEISHWCIAGNERRKLVDYGYWYVEESRSQLEQCHFEQVEVKPQALEWIFSECAGYKFKVSSDNFNPDVIIDRVSFKRNILHQVKKYLDNGINSRAFMFANELCKFYGRQFPVWADFNKI